MARRLLFLLPMKRASRLLPLLLLPLFACASDPPAPPPPPAPTPVPAPPIAPDPGREEEPDVPVVPTDKVDLLFVVDNSASMADKSSILASSVSSMLRKFVVEKNVKDIHVGIISTSLGSFGDVCPAEGRTNDRAHLLGTGVLSLAKSGSVERLVEDTHAGLLAVGENGCGLEAQLESMYRFLVQPDPPRAITIGAQNQAVFEGVDYELLAQRKAFLRPDSALAIVMLTDEDDSTPDPRSVRGQGWAFASRNFPGSTTFRGDPRNGTTAPRATSACSVDPTSEDCTSCALLPGSSDPECAKNGGYYAADEDSLNVRFHRMKQRFGIDPRFSIERYTKGLSSRKAPRRETEHDASGAYAHAATCTNPLFAGALPERAGDELCALPEGPRSRQLVMFHLIGGLPPALAGKRGDQVEWTKVLGANPDAYDFTGIDPHMIQSVAPRAGLEQPATFGSNGSDPVHGREWDTRKDDLQYACTFALPQPRACLPTSAGCDCAMEGSAPPLCGAQLGQQVRAKAYPTIQELRVAKALGDRAVVSSICAVGTDGYGAGLDLLVERMTPVLVN